MTQPTDTSEKGLESLIMRHLTGVDSLVPSAPLGVAEPAPATSGTGWLRGLSDPGVARAIGCVHRTPGQALDGADAGQRGRHVTLGLQRAF